MSLMILATVSVLAFCVCCRCFIKAVLKPLPVVGSSSYKRSALRVQKSYAIFAWAVMTGSFLMTLVVSFVQVYTTL